MSNGKFSNSFDLSSLYLDLESADLIIVLQPNDGPVERIPAHKCLLITKSKVFRAMLNDKWKEKDEVIITDVNPEPFKEFLKYFYHNEVELTMENVAAVIDLGHKYDIPECVKNCCALIERNLNESNVCLAYGYAILYELDELKDECEIIISLHPKEVFESQHFLECERETLAHILRIDSMACSEVDVFNACLDWVKTASGQTKPTNEVIQNHLGNLIYDIRLGTMPQKDFDAICTAHPNLLSRIECRTFTNQIKSKKGKPRKNPLNDTKIIECNRENDIIEYGYPVSEVETTTFSCNKTLLLREIVCADFYTYVGDCITEPDELDEDLNADLKIFELNSIDGESRTIFT